MHAYMHTCMHVHKPRARTIEFAAIVVKGTEINTDPAAAVPGQPPRVSKPWEMKTKYLRMMVEAILSGFDNIATSI